MKGDKRVLDFVRTITSLRRFKELGEIYAKLRPEHTSDDDAATAALQHLTEEEVMLLWKNTKTGGPDITSEKPLDKMRVVQALWAVEKIVAGTSCPAPEGRCVGGPVTGYGCVHEAANHALRRLKEALS